MDNYVLITGLITSGRGFSCGRSSTRLLVIGEHLHLDDDARGLAVKLGGGGQDGLVGIGVDVAVALVLVVGLWVGDNLA